MWLWWYVLSCFPSLVSWLLGPKSIFAQQMSGASCFSKRASSYYIYSFYSTCFSNHLISGLVHPLLIALGTALQWSWLYIKVKPFQITFILFLPFAIPMKWYLTKEALPNLSKHSLIFSILVQVKAARFRVKLRGFFNTTRLCGAEFHREVFLKFQSFYRI